MSSIERLNYLINDSEAVVARNALNHKLFNNTLLISITPDSSFNNISSISFIYQKTSTDKIQRDYQDVPSDLFSVHGDDLATKIILFSDTLSEADKVQISNYYKDTEKQLDQNIVNFFTLGFSNLVTLCQLIQTAPNLFAPYNVSLPTNIFDITMLTQSYIAYIDSFLFNIIQGKTTNVIKTLANNVSTFAKYFGKMFNQGVAFDITKPVQEAMRDFKDHTYNPTEIISNHINIIERNKDDFLNELRTEAEFHKQEIRDLVLNKEDPAYYDDVISKQQDLLSEIDTAQARLDDTIVLFEKKTAEAYIKIEALLLQVEKRYNDVEDLYNQTQSISNNASVSMSNQLDEKMVTDLVTKTMSSSQQKSDASVINRLDTLATRVDKESARHKNSISRLEKMLEKLLDSLDD